MGWSDIIPKDDKEKEEITKIMAKDNCIPVFLEKDTLIMYQMFMDQFLLNLMHNFQGIGIYDEPDVNNDLWHAYCEVNEIFAKKVIEIKGTSDMIWIHNYYLFMAPLYIKRKDIHANIGFYLHAPFPSSDIYNTFQFRLEILNSILCCDVIGFHIFEYARNFIAACEKIIRLE